MAEIVGPTLDQLDVWSGSIDALTTSLDSSDWNTAALREVANYRSSPTLEQLDAYSSSIDAIVTSLDSLTSFGTAEVITITAAATAGLTAAASAAPGIAITESATATRIQAVSDSVAIAITESATATHIQPVSASAAIAITASAPTLVMVSDIDGGTISGWFTTTGTATLVAQPTGTLGMAMTVVATDEKLGEAWSTVSAGGETWSAISAGGETWSQVSAGGETWRSAA